MGAGIKIPVFEESLRGCLGWWCNPPTPPSPSVCLSLAKLMVQVISWVGIERKPLCVLSGSQLQVHTPVCLSYEFCK